MSKEKGSSYDSELKDDGLQLRFVHAELSECHQCLNIQTEAFPPHGPMLWKTDYFPNMKYF